MLVLYPLKILKLKTDFMKKYLYTLNWVNGSIRHHVEKYVRNLNLSCTYSQAVYSKSPLLKIYADSILFQTITILGSPNCEAGASGTKRFLERQSSPRLEFAEDSPES